MRLIIVTVIAILLVMPLAAGELFCGGPHGVLASPTQKEGDRPLWTFVHTGAARERDDQVVVQMGAGATYPAITVQRGKLVKDWTLDDWRRPTTHPVLAIARQDISWQVAAEVAYAEYLGVPWGIASTGDPDWPMIFVREDLILCGSTTRERAAGRP